MSQFQKGSSGIFSVSDPPNTAA